MAEPMLLTYNLNPHMANRLSALCEAQGIRVRAVRRDEYALPIGALAGIPVAPREPRAQTDGFDDEMLVMCHMLSDQMDGFLRGMRACGIPRIALKAVLTPYNVAWDSRHLRDELAREHEQMQRRG